MNKYRRIEVKAFRQQTIVVSDQFVPAAPVNAKTGAPEDGVLLSDLDLGEPIEPDSPEGQRILVEALQSIERRLNSETRAKLNTNDASLVPAIGPR